MMMLLVVMMVVTVLGMGLRMTERYMMRNSAIKAGDFNKARRAIEENSVASASNIYPIINYQTVDDPEYGIYQGYPCPVWDENRIERELGGTDFSVCANIECPSCFPKGKCAVGDCSEPGKEPWRIGGVRFSDFNQAQEEWLCKPHFTVRQEERDALKKIMAAKEERRAREFQAQQLEIAKAKAERDAALERAALEARDNRPSTVPMYAYHVVDLSKGVIYWKWLDPETGKHMGAKQVIPLEDWTDTMVRGNSDTWIKPQRVAKPKRDALGRKIPDADTIAELEEKVEKLKRWATNKEWDELQ